MTKGAEPAGGKRWKTKRDPVPHKRACWSAKRAVCLGLESSAVELESGWRAPETSSFGVREMFESGAGLLVVGAQRSLESGRGSSPVQGCWSVEAAGERSPASDITVRGDRASGRSERCRGMDGLLKEHLLLREQRPVRSSEASSARPEPPGRTAGPGPTKSRGANCRVDETSRVAQRVTTRVTGNQHGLSELLQSPQLRELLKTHEVQFCPSLSWGFFE